MKGKTILITGGTGFLGSHIATVLQNAGYEIAIVDDLSNSEEEICANIHKITNNYPDFYNFDITEYSTFERVFNFYENIYAVIHCAGLTSSKDSNKRIFEYYDTNVNGTVNLINLMEKYGVKNLIFPSTCSLYDSNNLLAPFNENANIELYSTLETNKYIIEKLLKDFSIYKKFNILSLRFSNIIGAHQSGLLGEKFCGISKNVFYKEKSLLYSMFEVALGNKEKIQIYGGDWNTPDGSPVRDYINVMDAAESIINSLNFITKFELSNPNIDEGMFGIVNIGSGKGLSVKELVMKVENILGKRIPYEIINQKNATSGKIIADIQRAKEFLLWEPKYSIEDSIKNSWNYVNNESKSNLNN